MSKGRVSLSYLRCIILLTLILSLGQTANALVEYGALILHDSRIPNEASEAFLDIMEDYFDRPPAEILRDERPESHWQIGVTPNLKVRPKCAIEESCVDIVENLEPSERPVEIMHRPADPNWRFFWRITEKLPYKTAYPELNPTNVLPEVEPFRSQWADIMNTWGGVLRSR